MEFSIDLGLGAWLVVVIAAVLFGFVAQLIGETRFSYEWLPDAIGAGVGAVVASEFVTSWRTIEPVWDGLAISPAVLGGLVVGVIVAIATRYLSGGTYIGHASPA